MTNARFFLSLADRCSPCNCLVSLYPGLLGLGLLFQIFDIIIIAIAIAIVVPSFSENPPVFYGTLVRTTLKDGDLLSVLMVFSNHATPGEGECGWTHDV